MHLGQEIYSFFFKYGIYGIFGLFFSSIILSIIIFKTINISKKYNINFYDDFLNKITNNKIIINLIKIIVNIFLLISFYIMVAGFSEYVNQIINIEFLINIKLISIIFFLFFCYFIFNKKIEKIIKINSILIPFIIIIFILFGLKNISNINYNNLLIYNNNYNWIFSALFYVGYNSIALISFTTISHKLIKNKKNIYFISIIMGIIFFSLGSIIYFLLLNTENQGIPMLDVAIKFGGIYKYLYGVILLIAIFTTAISCGYSFLKNICKENNIKKYKIINLVTCILGIPISLLGFKNLINTIYPIFGVIALIQIYFLFKSK